MTTTDPRAEVAAERAAEAFTGKDPGMGHFVVSLLKSGVRIIGYVFLMTAGVSTGISAIVYAGIALTIAEMLGILEEVV